MSKSEKKTPIIKWLWIGAIASVIVVIGSFVILSFQKIPSFRELENPSSNRATELYSADGVVLGRYFTENRVPITFDEISPFVREALVSTEDERFYKHSGIDYRALPRVLVKTVILQNKSSGGASTITQQLAKNLYSDQKHGNMIQRFVPKLKEWITAVKLEKSYTKEEIMAMYLNQVDFVNGAHGIKAAGETYFGKTQEELDILEAAMIVGMLKNPSLFNPKSHPENALRRRNVVLKQMYRNDNISKNDYDSLRALPINISQFSRAAHDVGLAPYCRAEVKKMVNHILSQEAHKKPDGGKYNINRDGLRIYTTIDSRVQLHAEKAVTKAMGSVQKRFFRHWEIFGKDPWTYDEGEDLNDKKDKRLNSQIMDSDRFQSLMRSEFDGHLGAITKAFDNIEFTHTTLEVLQGEVEGEETIQERIDDGLTSEKRAAYLRKVANSSEFAELLPKWKSLKEKGEKIFDKKVKMEIFDFKSGQLVDTVMSPLDSIKYHRMLLQTGVLAIEPGSGHIKAWVGGTNFKQNKLDHVTINRQVGSTFKPFIYTTAIAFQSKSPCTKILDVPYTIARGEGRFGLLQDWAPKNSDNEYENKEITLYRGLQRSKNTVSVALMKGIGTVNPVLEIAGSFGINVDKLPPTPSICLGAADLTVKEMTAAYATFANNGVYVSPTVISRIEDANGRLIYRAPAEEHTALAPEVNYVMVDMLKSVANTNWQIRDLKSENGGKTGTTNNQTDGWYMGITPNLVVGVWVGGEDTWVRFRDLSNGGGGRNARPIYIEMMKAIEGDKDLNFDTDRKFHKPDNMTIEIDCDKYEDLISPETHPEEEDDEAEEFFEG